MACQCWNCRNPKFAKDGFVMPSHECKKCNGNGWYVIGYYEPGQRCCPVCSAYFSDEALDEFEEILRRRGRIK